MFDDVDETLRKLLIKEIPISGNEIEIAFDMPKREWSARLNRPTINLYLHDVRENAKLRQNYNSRVSQGISSQDVMMRRPELRVDLHYMITAWASEPDDEHRLLGRTLLALARNPILDDAKLERSLQNQTRPVMLTVAQYDALLNPTDIWGVLDNDLRPCLTCMLTLTLDPFAPVAVPVVRTRELRTVDLNRISMRKEATHQSARRTNGMFQPPSRRGQAAAQRAAEKETDGERREDEILAQYWTVGGMIDLERSLDGLQFTLLETGESIPLAGDGSFVIGNLPKGSYTLLLEDEEGNELLRRTIEVPSENYDIE